MKYKISKTDDLQNRLRNRSWNLLFQIRVRLKNRFDFRLRSLLDDRLRDPLWNRLRSQLSDRLGSRLYNRSDRYKI